MTDTALPPLLHLSPDDIDATALPRDRSDLDPAALAELETSILLDGLRQPIEVFEKPPADTGPRYGLISGLRRLTVIRRLGHAQIPAFRRSPADGAAAIAQMLAENEIRAQVTPWDKGRVILTALEAGLCDTLDEALARLYPALDRNRRTRLRAVAEVVAEIGDHRLTDPRGLTQNQLVRLAFALRQGFGPVIETALMHTADRSPETQWRLLLPIIEEAEEEARTPAPAYRPGRPRRILRPRPGLHIRRERTREGWTLRFTGPEATGPLMEDIMDAVERDFGKNG